MSNFDDVYQGFIIMVSLSLMGLIMAFFGGYLLDHLWEFFDVAGAVDVAGNWSSIGTQNMALNLYYGVCCIFPIVGVAAFVKSVIRKQGYNQYIMQ